MGLIIYSEFEAELVLPKGETTGEFPARDFKTLDSIAESAELVSFAAFGDSRPILDDFEGDPRDLDDVLGRWNEWFDSGEGSAAMQALADHIKANPKAAKQLDRPEEVVAELEEMARDLGVAAAQGIRFRLQMS